MANSKTGHDAIGISPAGSPSRNIIRGWDGYEKKTGRDRVTGWRDVRAGRFPPPFELGPNSIGWYEYEIDEWLASRPRRTYTSPAAV
jgi:prophage regulatory protein